MPTLRILLLGSPAVYLDTTPIRINRRLQRALLFYLAAHAHPVGRAELLTLFWPEENEDDARRHLREALSKLRAELPDPTLLLATRDRVGLSAGVYVDALEFQSLIDQLGRAPWQFPPAQPLPESLYQRLLKAARLWRSPRFLAGASLPNSAPLDDWLVRTAQRLEHARQNALERLADHAAASGDMEGALQWLRLALDHDELNEDLHYRVLSLLARIGRRGEALEYCKTLHELFQRELGGPPSAAIQALCERVRQDAVAPTSTAGAPGWPLSLSMQLPFIGRCAALSDLQAAYHQGGLALISGEVGAGKSRLVLELFLSLEPAPRLLLAPARQGEAGLPFQPLIELLRHSVDAREWQELPAVWCTSLAQLLPELVEIRPDVRPDAAGGRSVLFEALYQFLKRLARSKRILLFLDNAQWADADTLAALMYLRERSFFRKSGLLAVACRPEERGPALEDWLNANALLPNAREISLPPLTQDDIAELASLALGSLQPGDELVRRLAVDTGGNPFFLLETLRAMLEMGVAWDGGALPLARSIHALARTRLGRLSPAGRQAALAAAIAGPAFDLADFEAALDARDEAVVTAVEELGASGLIDPLPGADAIPAFRFRHAKVREALLLEISPARALLLRGRIAHTRGTQVDSLTE